MILFATMIAAQGPHALKPFTVPGDLYTVEPAVAKDEGCAQDYARALAQAGLAQRKMLAELVAYKCLEVLPFRYRVWIVGTKTFESGGKQFPMARVRLSIGGVPVGTDLLKEGWVVSAALMTLDRAMAVPMKAPVSNPPKPVDPPIVTIVAYQRIRTGMSYKQVRGIVGTDGTELSRSDFGEHWSVTYSWKNQNGSNMIATFRDDELISKAQFGLQAP